MAWTSGRAPSTRTASPMNTSTPAGSPATGSRRIRTRATSTSSVAQPVTGNDPVSPLDRLAGVSNASFGAIACGLAIVLSVAVIWAVTLAAPVNVSVTAPLCVTASPFMNGVVNVNAAGPGPDVGDTTSHGTLDDAVHVTVPAGPDCVRRTVWPAVWLVKAAPGVTPPQNSAGRASGLARRRPVPACVVVNARPPAGRLAPPSGG